MVAPTMPNSKAGLQAAMTGGTLRYMDHAAQTTVEMNQIMLEAQIPDFNGAATISGSARASGQDVAFSGTISRFAPFLSGRLVP